MTTASEPPRYREYLSLVVDLLQAIGDEEEESIRDGARALADRVAEDRLIYVIGPGGHSSIGAQEVFCRAGGLACIYAILDEGFSLGAGAFRSTAIERTPGYADALLKTSGISAGDVLVIVNAYGVNAATIDSAEFARRSGITSIGVTSIEYQRSLPTDHPARHPSKQNLCDIADIVIDTKVPMGDALLSVDGVRQAVGPASTFANTFAMNALMLETVTELARRGIEPLVWKSGNSPGADEANEAAIRKYGPRVKKL